MTTSSLLTGEAACLKKLGMVTFRARLGGMWSLLADPWLPTGLRDGPQRKLDA